MNDNDNSYDNNYKFRFDDISKPEIMFIVTKGNPGAINLIVNLFKLLTKEELCNFLNKIWKQKLIGERLWYIYKNECKFDVNSLLSRDLSIYDDEYFQKAFNYTQPNR